MTRIRSLALGGDSQFNNELNQAQVIASLFNATTGLPLNIVGTPFALFEFSFNGKLVIANFDIAIEFTDITVAIDLILPPRFAPRSTFAANPLMAYTLTSGGISQTVPLTVWTYAASNSAYGLPFLEFQGDFQITAGVVQSPGTGGVNFPVSPDTVEIYGTASWALAA